MSANVSSGLDVSFVLAIIAIIVSVASVLFSGWEAYHLKRMSDLEKQELDLHKLELEQEQERFLSKKSETITFGLVATYFELGGMHIPPIEANT